MLSGTTTHPSNPAVPRDRVADVCATLFDWYNAERQTPGGNPEPERMGPFIHRMGYAAVLDQLKADDRTTNLLERRNPAMMFDPYIEKNLV